MFAWLRSFACPAPTLLSAHFSPPGCAQAIIAEIGNAKKLVYVQAYTFTHLQIAGSLIIAKKRGIDVQIILDNEAHTGKGELGPYCKQNGVPVFLDAAHKIAHNKIIIIDDSTVCVGSFNFTNNAEHENAENFLIVHNAPTITAEYKSNWFTHRLHSKAML